MKKIYNLNEKLINIHKNLIFEKISSIMEIFQ